MDAHEDPGAAAAANYRLLGRSGLQVSQLALGTMTFGTEWGWGSDRDEVGRILDTYLDRGGNFLDTAGFCTGGTSERLIGEYLGPRRERIVLATKYTNTTDPRDPNATRDDPWSARSRRACATAERTVERDLVPMAT